MNRLSVVVCDEDSSYSNKLSEYLREKGKLTDVCVCKADEAESFYAAGNQDIYLIDAAVWAAIQEKLRDSKKLLQESGERENRESGVRRKQIICLASDEVAESVADCPRIYKYQSADIILQEMYKVIVGRVEACSVRGRKRGKTIGLISPWYDGTSLLAGLAMSGSLAKKGSVLYINSRGYHGMPFVKETGTITDLSDVLLALRMQSGNAAAKIMSGTVSCGDFSCMVSVRRAGQIADIAADDYEKLIEIIWKNMEYDYVVMELQPELAELPKILELCDVVYSFLKKEYGSERIEEQIRGMQSNAAIKVQQFPKALTACCDENTYGEPLAQAGCMREWMEQLLEEGE